MRKVYHLSSCNTCQRVLKEVDADGNGLELVDIKVQNVSPEDLDTMQRSVGSYEALFSKRAMKFRSLGLHEKTLTEQDYRELILGEYTFLKRPVFMLDGKIFAGNQKKTIAAVIDHLNGTA